MSYNYKADSEADNENGAVILYMFIYIAWINNLH